MKVRVRNAYSVYIPELYATLISGRDYEVPEWVVERYGEWLEPLPVENPQPQDGEAKRGKK